MNRQEFLIAIMNNQRDYQILLEKQWYRIPASMVEGRLKKRWPPRWIGFYQTRIFGEEKWAVRYFARVGGIQQVRRRKLLPNEPLNEKSNKMYYKINLEEIMKLPEPIVSRNWRRIVFIQTNWTKFINAQEINDLFDESPLEDQLWAALKLREISAERQEYVTINQQNYFLDFAIYCDKGNLDVETDGDSWHANPEKAAEDRLRDNALSMKGWKVLRFGTREIRERTAEYCLPTIAESINKLGGIDLGKYLPQKINLEVDSSYQRSLFDDM